MFLLCVAPAFATTNVTSCTPINVTDDYVLQNDVSGSDCFLISVNGASLDCQGYSINGMGGKGVAEDTVLVSAVNGFTLRNCDIYNSSHGFYASGRYTGFVSQNIYSINNTFRQDSYGIFMRVCSGCVVNQSTFYQNGYGMFEERGSSISVYNNTFDSNSYAFYTGEYVYGVNFTYNRVVNSSAYGLMLNGYGYVSGNYFYNNYFNNTNSVGTINGANYWNVSGNGTRITDANIWDGLGGNYYVSFSDNCTDADLDGYCDGNLTFDSSNIDYFPLAEADIVCTADEVSCQSGDVVTCYRGIRIDLVESCVYGCNPSPSPYCMGVFESFLTDVGSGFGSLLDLITAPFVYMLLIFAMISSVFTIFYVIATMIKNSFR
jgi:parallel beta-helix repeat protein